MTETWDRLWLAADHFERGLLLKKHAEHLADADYWRAVSAAWSDSDRQPLGPKDWRKLWLADRPGREQVMTAAEQKELAALPERVHVYRGINIYNHFSGLSWTLDQDLAHWFAERGPGPGLRVVVGGTVRRCRILALKQDRQEHEIVVQPKYVYQRSMSVPDPARTATVRALKAGSV